MVIISRQLLDKEFDCLRDSNSVMTIIIALCKSNNMHLCHDISTVH